MERANSPSIHLSAAGMSLPDRAPGRRASIALFLIVSICLAGLPVWAKQAPGPAGQFLQLHFSPDGQYVLAQDKAEITVLTVEPFEVDFHIPAVDSEPAEFTPDSRQIVFVTAENSTYKVEPWSMITRARANSTVIPLTGCVTERISPDGSALACDDSRGHFRLIDVTSGKVLAHRQFGKPIFAVTDIGPTDPSAPDHAEYKRYEKVPGHLGIAQFEFSPDGRFFIGVPAVSDTFGLLWDLEAGKEVAWRRDLWRIRWTYDDFLRTPPFTFVASDRIVISRWESTAGWKKLPSELVAFPSGKAVLSVQLPAGQIIRTADPNYIIVRPFETHAIGAVELSTGQVIVSETPALDVFGKLYVAELADGRPGLYEIGKGLKATVSLKPR